MTLNTSTILITGGAGFIGSHTTEALLAAGASAIVFDNFSAGKRSNLPASHPALTIVEGDIRDLPALDRAMQKATHVMHLAAQISVQLSVQDPLNSCHNNVVGFVNVLECARKRGVKRVEYASSAAVYGTPQELPLKESSPVAPISPYGLEKCIDDQYAGLYHALYGLSALGMRYFNVYGPRQDPSSQYAGVISKFASAIATGNALKVFGDGGQTRDFAFVRDIARINVRAPAATATGFCNIGTGSSVTLLDLIAALERVSSRSAIRKFEPPATGDIRHSAMLPERQLEWLGDKPATPLDAGLAALLRETQ
ncbi:MAG: NAD-dependent epimerase/dehydratase family protein [Betaproteobacteria bacterium]|nr:NAD-dependent epimerase/dehydratase family protein [Betaproteobacteria bacterium]